MLLVLNIGIILFLLGMVAIWSTYGFFSSFLHLMIVIVAGVFAFAVWEPLAYWLLGRMPAMAWGVGLLAPFALGIILLRVVFDKYCKMNLKFPRVADQAGGGACGLVSGVLCGGVLLIGAGFLSSSPDILGYEPYRMVQNKIEASDEGQLWPVTRVDRWAGGFFGMISTGSMRPTYGMPLDVAKPDIARQAAVFHLTEDPNQAKAAPPEAVKMLGAQVLSRDEYLEFIVTACFQAIVTDQIDLEEIYFDAFDAENVDLYGGYYVDAILAEYETRKGNAGRRGVESTPETRPSALFDTGAVLALLPLITGAEPAAAPDDEAAKDALRDSLGEDVDDAALEAALSEIPLKAFYDDPLTFFDSMIENQIKPTIDAMDQTLVRAGAQQVIVVDTQWSKDPPGAYGADGWLRVAVPAVRLLASSTRDETTVYDEIEPIAYSIETNQGTGGRLFVDLLTHQYFNAYAQNDAVKLGWVFPVSEGQQGVRFVARQLGFDLAAALKADPLTVIGQAMVLGSIDVPAAVEAPEGIQIGKTSAVADLGERLPRPMSPNAATQITPNRESEPWTAVSGRQDNILPGSRGGVKSQMREADVVAGFRLVRVLINADAAQNFLGQAPQGNQPMWLRDSTQAEHDIIGFALLKEDRAMSLTLRPRGTLDTGDLPRVGVGEVLYLYFQVPDDVTITEFVFSEKDGAGLPLATPIQVTPR